MFQTIWIDIKYCFRGNLDIALNVAEKNLRDKQIKTVRFENIFFLYFDYKLRRLLDILFMLVKSI